MDSDWVKRAGWHGVTFLASLGVWVILGPIQLVSQRTWEAIGAMAAAAAIAAVIYIHRKERRQVEERELRDSLLLTAAIDYELQRALRNAKRIRERFFGEKDDLTNLIAAEVFSDAFQLDTLRKHAGQLGTLNLAACKALGETIAISAALRRLLSKSAVKSVTRSSPKRDVYVANHMKHVRERAAAIEIAIEQSRAAISNYVSTG